MLSGTTGLPAYSLLLPRVKLICQLICFSKRHVECCKRTDKKKRPTRSTVLRLKDIAQQLLLLLHQCISHESSTRFCFYLSHMLPRLEIYLDPLPSPTQRTRWSLDPLCDVRCRSSYVLCADHSHTLFFSFYWFIVLTGHHAVHATEVPR